MRKFYLVALILGLFTGFLSSCEDDDEFKPNTEVVQIVSENGEFSVAQEDTLFLKARLSDQANATFSWTMDEKEVSTDSVYMFIAEEMGNYKIKVKASNHNGSSISEAAIGVHGKYKHGTFVLNEGSAWSTPRRAGTLIFISPKGIVTDSVYYKENGGFLGFATQDLYIKNNKMYIISQNGGNDGGYLTVLNAETLKKERSYQDELDGELRTPTHVAVLGDDDIYIRDENGIHRFTPSSGTLTFIEGSERAKISTMAVANGKVFAIQQDKLIVIEANQSAVSKSISFSGNISGVIPSSDGNIWLACGANGEEAAKIIKLNAKDYTTQENPIEDATAANILNGGWNATPYITAKGDTLYMGSDSESMPVYRHIFGQKKTEHIGNMLEQEEDVRTLYNCIAVHPITGDIYANLIWSYSLDPENKICVFGADNNQLKLKTYYKGHTECSAGIFFTYNFE